MGGWIPLAYMIVDMIVEFFSSIQHANIDKHCIRDTLPLMLIRGAFNRSYILLVSGVYGAFV